jgi:hypothetical protein
MVMHTDKESISTLLIYHGELLRSDVVIIERGAKLRFFKTSRLVGRQYCLSPLCADCPTRGNFVHG